MTARWPRLLIALALGALATTVWGAETAARQAQQAQTPSPKAPGVVVLFSGAADEMAANWVKRGTDQAAAWRIENGAMVVGGGDIATKREFGDFQLHIEFRTPDMPNATGQGKGNSGIGLFGRYEIQVLDSYGIETPGQGDCGAVYGQAAPLVNACKPPMVWQTFDIVFRAPRMDANNAIIEKPRVTVIQNGIVVQNNVEISGMTGIQSAREREPSKTGGISLQDHGNRVEYRSIWVMPLPEKGSGKY
ncbi:MAG: DUF1080 domain-containing protein [Armatimonadetes bacterium]|nr:DUF1080 domain-containing protein [Armatimonadota bacterium]